MSDTHIGGNIIGSLEQTVTVLERALVEESGNLTPRQEAQALLAITKGVLMTIDNHYACPALRFYLGFEKWIWPILFGLILIGILGGVAAFRQLGLVVPAP